jgi:hypothetical protein
MTIITFTVAHWYAQKKRRYPRWDNYTNARACTYADAHANADAYADADVYTNVGRYNLTCAKGGTQR